MVGFKSKRALKEDPGDFSEKYVKEVAKLMQEEIDWRVLCDLLVEQGWTKVHINWSSISASKSHYIKEWCKNTLTGHYKGRSDTWLFENEKDAIIFTLKWS